MAAIDPLLPLYQPRPLQLEIHDRLERFKVLVCHRRFGKTVLCLNELIAQALTEPKDNQRYAYVAPLYRQAKQAAWDYLKHYSSFVPGRTAHETELRVDFPNGARIQLFGANEPDSLRGMYFDGAILDEYALMSPRAWTEVLRPALADRGGFAIFIGTPKGRNAFYELYERARLGAEPGWYAALHKASVTGVIGAEELAAARRDMSEEEYEQEFECSFQAAIAGAYYGKAMAAAEADGRIGKVPWEPALLVHTAWDLGIGDSTVIWFVQLAGRELHWIDYYEKSGAELGHYVKHLKGKPYVYGDHLLPHDAEAHELGTGKSRVELLMTLGMKPRIVPRQSVEDGINALRMLLPRSWFDAAKCARGIEALRQYRREWDEKGGLFRARPLHDWTSHAADAARYAALGLREPKDDRRKLPAMAEGGYSIFRH